MSDQLTAIIRVTCTQLIGALATWALRLGVDIDTTAALTLVLPLTTALVYALIHWAEVHVDRRIGWLLGIAKAPQYPGSGLK